MELYELDRAIVGELILGKKVYERLQELCALGTRFAGTAGEKLSQEYMMNELTSYGLKPRLEEFEHLAWQRQSSQLEILSPIAKELMSVSLAGAPSTPTEGIEGEILFLGDGTPSEFEAHKELIKGRIVLVTSLSPQCECSPPRQCHRRTKYGRAVAYGATALLFMNNQPGMLPQVGSTRQNREGEIPAVSIPFEEGKLLQHYLTQGPVKVRLQASNRSFLNRTGNIVAEIHGRKADEVVVIGGHYDCHDNSPGATDNGAGVALLLELARIMRMLDAEYEKTIRFVFFGVEEMAAVGSSFYVARHQDELERIHLFINLDGVGQRGGKTFDTQGFDDVSEYVLGMAKQLGHRMKTPQPAFSGDALPFVLAGVPTMAMKRGGADSIFGHELSGSDEDRGWGHTAADTLDKVQPFDLDESAIVAGQALLRAATHTGAIARRRSEAEVKAILAQHGMNEVLSFMKWPTIPIGPKEYWH